MHTNMEHAYITRSYFLCFCYFACVIGLNVHLFQI